MSTDNRVHLLSILVSNHFGVLMRVTTIFSRRACNIKSLTVAETQDPEVSRITITFEAGDKMAAQIEKLLQKQEDVIKAVCLPTQDKVDRELLMVKVTNTPALEADMEALRQTYSTRILGTTGGVSMVEFTGTIHQTQEFICLMEHYGLVEICRTGAIALSMGEKSIYEA